MWKQHSSRPKTNGNQFVKEKKKIIVLSSRKYEFLPLLHITSRKLQEKSFWLLWLCDMRQHFLSDIIGNYLVKKIVRFFFLIPAPFHCTHISWLIKRKVFEACWPQGDIVCLLCRIIPISSESSFLGHHDYLEKERQQEGVSRRSVCGHQFWWGL